MPYAPSGTNRKIERERDTMINSPLTSKFPYEADFSSLYVSVQNAKSANFKVLPLKPYQTMKGFGGAMTDSSVFNIGSLTPGARNQLLR
jgi:hypothetical protein